jgi:hypothetical protein
VTRLPLPYPIGVIPAQRLRAEPVYWNWTPPAEADWEWARTDHHYGKPVEDEDEVAFRVLERWCRYRCGICGASDPSYRIVMDHDHGTRLARGTLCKECNCREGFGGGPVFDLYRQRPPAAICGVRLTWWPASTLPAAPEILRFQYDLANSKWFTKGRDHIHRRSEPWFESEEWVASRDDLTDEEVARILGRTAGAVAARRRTLTLGLPDIDTWQP